MENAARVVALFNLKELKEICLRYTVFFENLDWIEFLFQVIFISPLTIECLSIAIVSNPWMQGTGDFEKNSIMGEWEICGLQDGDGVWGSLGGWFKN